MRIKELELWLYTRARIGVKSTKARVGISEKASGFHCTDSAPDLNSNVRSDNDDITIVISHMRKPVFTMPIGKIEPFPVDLQNWDNYVRRAKQFIALNDINDKLQAATLLTLAGASAIICSCDLCSLDNQESKQFEELVIIKKKKR
ncbi:hypothetical protein EVAR_90182_1 [Eumeta japonica]|uniref:Uncharacterized protein n=1 Tax=Eumeta variegata TaxID=151549 RepID=A0A4C1WW90_EUMVA|nr:hypothetical protein EVAR_90182_1 [Eumeta japonica]